LASLDLEHDAARPEAPGDVVLEAVELVARLEEK